MNPAVFFPVGPATEPNNSLENGREEKVDLISIAAALVMGFIALGSEPWWLLRGTTTSQLLEIRVSPFNAILDGIALPSTIPLGNLIGAITRLLLLNASILLGLSAFRPNSWWRKTVQWLTISTLAEVFLSFSLLLHASRIAMFNVYGTETPIYGTQTLYGNILGLDLANYTNPSLTASFAFPFYLGIASLAIVGSTQLLRAIRHPEEVLAASELVRGAKEVHLTPPYSQVWLASADRDLNPLNRDPDHQTDDQLAISFEKLNKTLQPGGIVRIIVPAWAANLGDRLARLVPWAGFRAEKSEIIYRESGRPEQELLFRKPMMVGGQTLEVEIEQPPDEIVQPSSPPVEDETAEPVWTGPMTKPERTMVKTAVSIITRRREPVPYRELINEIYMELLDRKIEFDSAREIENTLIQHAGRELALIEGLGETGTSVTRKWWLGDKGISQNSGREKYKVPSVLHFIKKWQKPPRSKYKPKKHRDED